MSAALRERRESRDWKIEFRGFQPAPEVVLDANAVEKEEKNDRAEVEVEGDGQGGREQVDVAAAAAAVAVDVGEEEDAVERTSTVFWRSIVAAGLLVSVLPVSGTSLVPSGPQMTSRIGNNFGQLLTSSAVLIMLGLAGDGGGRGWIICGEVDTRRSGGGIPPGGTGAGGRCALPPLPDVSWAEGERTGFPELEDELAVVAGAGVLLSVDDAGTEGLAGLIVFSFRLWLLASPLGTGEGGGFGTIIEAKKRTVRWCTSVATALSVRKKRYWTTIGAVERGVEEREEDLSIRAHVRYTSKRRRRIPRRIIERC